MRTAVAASKRQGRHAPPEQRRRRPAFVRGKEKSYTSTTFPKAAGNFSRKPLDGEGINLETVSVDQVPNNIVQLQNYDAIILANVPAPTSAKTDSR